MSLTTEPVASHSQDCTCEKCLSALRHGEMLDAVADLNVSLKLIADVLREMASK